MKYEMPEMHISTQTHEGINLGYLDVMPKVIERTSCGEYPHRQMMREMLIELEPSKPM